MPAPLVLIIEDEYLIASDISNGLKARGFEVAFVASDRAAATWLDANEPDLAIIDIQLLDGQRGLAAARLKKAGVPFIVHSGYDPAFRSFIFQDAPYLAKPAPVHHLVDLASKLMSDRGPISH